MLWNSVAFGLWVQMQTLLMFWQLWEMLLLKVKYFQTMNCECWMVVFSPVNHSLCEEDRWCFPLSEFCCPVIQHEKKIKSLGSFMYLRGSTWKSSPTPISYLLYDKGAPISTQDSVTTKLGRKSGEVLKDYTCFIVVYCNWQYKTLQKLYALM